MAIVRKQLYRILITSCIVGYVWVYFNLKFGYSESYKHSFCLMKNITNVPCPSCGSTRAVISFIHGDFLQSLYWNPMGLIILSIMIVLPPWLIYDYATRKESLLNFYSKFEAIIRRRRVAIVAIVLVLLNWIWNIYKGL